MRRKVRGRKGRLQALAATYAVSRSRSQSRSRSSRPPKLRGRWLIQPFDRIHEGKKGYNRRRLKGELLWELVTLWGLDPQDLTEGV